MIERDRITAVTPWKKAKIPKNAQVVDGTGKFLMPVYGNFRMRRHPGLEELLIG